MKKYYHKIIVKLIAFFFVMGINFLQKKEKMSTYAPIADFVL